MLASVPTLLMLTLSPVVAFVGSAMLGVYLNSRYQRQSVK